MNYLLQITFLLLPPDVECEELQGMSNQEEMYGTE